MVKEIFAFDVFIDGRSKTPKYVVYLIGKWDLHIMDWRGCNYRRIKAPNQPVFTTIKDAIEWAESIINKPEYRRVDGEGIHVPELPNESTVLSTVYDGNVCHPWRHDTFELTQEQWDELRQMIRKERKKERR